MIVNQEQLTGEKSYLIMFISAQIVAPCSMIHEWIYFHYHIRRLLTVFADLRRWTFKKLLIITQSHSLYIAVI